MSNAFAYVGNPLPDWTAIHSLRAGKSVADYRGKVVLIDFWATWCPWCIKSFPAMRDLHEEYGPKGFAIVGVTTSAPNVWAARYDLDDDMKSKLGEAPAGGERPKGPPPTISLGREPTPEQKDAHREKEKEVLAKFVENHEVPWDVVVIDEKEPRIKYGVPGWPHGLILDKKGRVRAIHGGALLRTNEKRVAEVRHLIESLLAEPD
jgi:thiol-disulfide isomerase/thioredoxin